MSEIDKAVLALVTLWRNDKCACECSFCKWCGYCHEMVALAIEVEKRLVGGRNGMV